MIDIFSQLFSTLMVMYIVLRAVKLDRVLPWFETRSLYERGLPREAAAREAAKTRVRAVWPEKRGGERRSSRT